MKLSILFFDNAFSGIESYEPLYVDPGNFWEPRINVKSSLAPGLTPESQHYVVRAIQKGSWEEN
jgi:hypothetical protein